MSIFGRAGWSVLDRAFMGVQPVLDDITTDVFAVASLGPERLFQADPSRLPRIITGEECGRLAPEFRHLSPDELSAVDFAVTLSPA